jgi:hypothetical protein
MRFCRQSSRQMLSQKWLALKHPKALDRGMLDQRTRLRAGPCLGVAPRLYPDFLGRICKLLKGIAGTTGLEPAASAVTV